MIFHLALALISLLHIVASKGQISINIEGDPNLQVDMNVGNPVTPEELSYDGYILTGMRLVNAILEVVKAKPGILTVHDIPLYVQQTAFRSDATYVPHKILVPKK